MRRGLLFVAWVALLTQTPLLHGAPRYEWYFEIEEGLANFAVQPFAVDRPARIEVYVEWFPVAELEVALYSPGKGRPLRDEVARGWLRWQLTTDDTYPWKGLWRIYLRSVSPSTFYQGRIIVFLDYTYTPRRPDIPAEEAPPSVRPKESARLEKWGLQSITLAPDESFQQMQVRVRVRLPTDVDRSGLRVRLESPEGVLRLQETLPVPKGDDVVEPVSRPYPVFLGLHCVRATLEGLSPGVDRKAWQEHFEQCFRVRCEPSVRVRTVETPETSDGTGLTALDLIVDPEKLQVRPVVRVRLPESTLPDWHLTLRGEDEALPLREAWDLQIRQDRWVGRPYPIPLGRHCARAELTGSPRPDGLTEFPACFQIQCSPTTRVETVVPEKSPPP